MKITDKTVYRVITLVVSAMLLISLLTTGLSLLSSVLIGAFIMSLFNDDLASYEYSESRKSKNVNKV